MPGVPKISDVPGDPTAWSGGSVLMGAVTHVNLDWLPL
jgi:hypothetical protein